EHDRRVIIDGRGCSAVFKCGKVKEWLEGRAWLPLGLGCSIVFALVKAVAASQGLDGAGLRVKRNKGTLNSWNLCQCDCQTALNSRLTIFVICVVRCCGQFKNFHVDDIAGGDDI